VGEEPEYAIPAPLLKAGLAAVKKVGMRRRGRRSLHRPVMSLEEIESKNAGAVASGPLKGMRTIAARLTAEGCSSLSKMKLYPRDAHQSVMRINSVFSSVIETCSLNHQADVRVVPE